MKKIFLFFFFLTLLLGAGVANTIGAEIPNQVKLDAFIEKISTYEKVMSHSQYAILLDRVLSQIDALDEKYPNNETISPMLKYLETSILKKKIAVLEIQIQQKELIKDTPSKTSVMVYIITDKRCTDCHNQELSEQIQTLPFLKNATVKELDYSSFQAQGLLKQNAIQFLPAVLLNTNKISDENFVKFLKATPAKLYNLELGSTFDPQQEICDNKIDDNADGKIDCEDEKCAKDFVCAPKVDKPVADLYIMSYCPYGLQAQKGYLEVMDKLGKVVDINVKFVPYVMHGQKEADENVVQYCIQKEQKETYLPYLKCFLKKEGQAEACLKTAKVNNDKLQACITSTKKDFNVDEKMTDPSKQFPDFDIDREEALKAGVEGSPTFVVNGIKIEDVGRNAKEYAQKICSTFKVKPKECEETFQNINFDPMFGFTSKGENADAGCGQ